MKKKKNKDGFVRKSDVLLIIQNYIRGIQMHDYSGDRGIPQLYEAMRQIDDMEVCNEIEACKNDLINILATQLLKTDWGHCYMCTNPMKNITLDGVNNGCDGECRSDDDFGVDDLLAKIMNDIEFKR